MSGTEYLKIFLAETLGTMILILLGDGVVANVVLKKTKGNNSGWIVITMGWAFGTFVPALMLSKYSGSHFNPALSLALACTKKIKWINLPFYFLGEFFGAFLGACLVFLFYYDHFNDSEEGEEEAKLSVFSTIPAIKNKIVNFFSEVVATFVLVLGILMMGDYSYVSGVGCITTANLILVIGLSLGGTTGYAINPCRDLSPRIAHSILPIPGKGSSQWDYAWIPVFGPFVGAVLAGYFYKLFKLLD